MLIFWLISFIIPYLCHSIFISKPKKNVYVSPSLLHCSRVPPLRSGCRHQKKATAPHILGYYICHFIYLFIETMVSTLFEYLTFFSNVYNPLSHIHQVITRRNPFEVSRPLRVSNYILNLIHVFVLNNNLETHNNYQHFKIRSFPLILEAGEPSLTF